MALGATVRASYEYTLPDTETGRRWAIYDTRFSLSAPAFFKEKAVTGISFTPSLGLIVPTSLESWNAGMITAISLGLTASRSFGNFDFRASVSGSRSIYGQAASGYRNPDPAGKGIAPRDSNGNLLAICRPNETLCATGGMNPAWAVSASGSIQWRASGSFLFYIGYTYIRSWKNPADGDVGPSDPLRPQALDVNGNAAAKPGASTGSDRTITFFGGSYQLNEHYSLDLGMYTAQTPLFVDKDGVQRVRFPFLSLGAWNDNATSVFFTLSAGY
jgi:hypothetical protein